VKLNPQDNLSYIIRVNGEWVPAMPDDEEFSSQQIRDYEETLASRLTSLSAIVAIVYGVGWIILLSSLSRVGIDPWIRLVQCIGLLCVAGIAMSVWNVWLTFKGRRSLWCKAWSILLSVGLMEVVWFSFAFHLISGNVNY
jgi:hypothetical protein